MVQVLSNHVGSNLWDKELVWKSIHGRDVHCPNEVGMDLDEILMNHISTCK